MDAAVAEGFVTVFVYLAKGVIHPFVSLVKDLLLLPGLSVPVGSYLWPSHLYNHC